MKRGLALLESTRQPELINEGDSDDGSSRIHTGFILLPTPMATFSTDLGAEVVRNFQSHQQRKTGDQDMGIARLMSAVYP